jgi:hypothetical protein
MDHIIVANIASFRLNNGSAGSVRSCWRSGSSCLVLPRRPGPRSAGIHDIPTSTSAPNDRSWPLSFRQREVVPRLYSGTSNGPLPVSWDVQWMYRNRSFDCTAARPFRQYVQWMYRYRVTSLPASTGLRGAGAPKEGWERANPPMHLSAMITCTADMHVRQTTRGEPAGDPESEHSSRGGAWPRGQKTGVSGRRPPPCARTPPASRRSIVHHPCCIICIHLAAGWRWYEQGERSVSIARAPYTHTRRIYTVLTMENVRLMLIPRPRRPPPPCCLARVGWLDGSPASLRVPHPMAGRISSKRRRERGGIRRNGRMDGTCDGARGKTEQRPRSDRTLGLASPTKESACFCWTALAELRASERATWG